MVNFIIWLQSILNLSHLNHLRIISSFTLIHDSFIPLTFLHLIPMLISNALTMFFVFYCLMLFSSFYLPFNYLDFIVWRILVSSMLLLCLSSLYIRILHPYYYADLHQLLLLHIMCYFYLQIPYQVLLSFHTHYQIFLIHLNLLHLIHSYSIIALPLSVLLIWTYFNYLDYTLNIILPDLIYSIIHNFYNLFLLYWYLHLIYALHIVMVLFHHLCLFIMHILYNSYFHIYYLIMVIVLFEYVINNVLLDALVNLLLVSYYTQHAYIFYLPHQPFPPVYVHCKICVWFPLRNCN